MPPKLLEEERALLKPEFFPGDSGVELLDELREEHQRLLATQAEAREAATRLRERFEAEDEEQRSALADAYLDDAKPKAEPSLPPGERDAQLRAANLKAKAAWDALEAFLRDALQEITDSEAQWVAQVDARKAEAAAMRAEADRLMAEATAAERSTVRFSRWLERTAHYSTGWGYMAYSDVDEPPPPPEIDWHAARGVHPDDETFLVQRFAS